MLFGVAVVAMSIIVSAIVAVVVGSTYEAIVDRRRPVDVPLPVVAMVALSVVAGGLLGAGLG
jgi:hypothetical protein